MTDAISLTIDRIAEGLRRQGARVATAESCTGGGIAHAMTAMAGSSEWFECGWVTYSNAAKQHQLGVPADTLASAGAVSQPVVEAMVRGAQQHSGAEYAVAVSGVAGPGGGTADKPVGTVWLAWGGPGGQLKAECFHFDGDRTRVRQQSVLQALKGLLAMMGGSTV